jgi:hypothetical protein
MQYKLKRKEEFIQQYVQKLNGLSPLKTGIVIIKITNKPARKA